MRAPTPRAAAPSDPPAVAIFYFLLLLLITGVYKLLPGQLEAVQYRMVYYFFGQEADKPGVYVQRFLAGLLGNSSAREL